MGDTSVPGQSGQLPEVGLSLQTQMWQRKSGEGDPISGGQESTGAVVQLTALRAPSIQELLADPIIAEARDQMESAEHEQVFMIADALAKRYMLKRVVAKLPQEQQEAACMVIETTNFGKVGKTESERKPFIRLAMIHQAVSRMLILEMIKNPQQHGFNQLETAELQAGVDLADATDDIYADWEFRGHAIPYAEGREGRGFTSKWHIVEVARFDDQANPQYEELSYNNIYPNEYKEILDVLSLLIGNIQHLQERLKEGIEIEGVTEELLASKLAYYTALSDAYSETDPKKLPETWLKVDRAFVHQGGRLRAVHPMETGYATNETGMIPEQSIRFFLPNHPANTAIAKAKQALLEKLPEFLQGNPEALQGLKTIENCDAQMAYYAVRSGFELVFKIAGHNIPNEELVRSQDGVSAFLDPDTMKQRLGEGRPLFYKFFGEQADQLLAEVSDDDALVGIATHELGHNIGNPQGKLGGYEAVEEWKATATNNVLHAVEGDGVTDEKLRSSFLSDLVQFFRYSQRRGEASQKPYYGADKFFMKTAQVCGLIKSAEDGKWTLDLSRQNFDKYNVAILEQWKELQGIYSRKDQEGLDKFVAQHVVDTPFVADVAAFIDEDKKTSM